MARQSLLGRCGRTPGFFTGLVAVVTCVSGCVDPKANYEDFIQRPFAVPEASVADVQVTPCQDLLAQDLSGLYFTSCRPKALPVPFALAVTQTFTLGSDGVAKLDFSFFPIKREAATISETVGVRVDLPSTTVKNDCTYVETINTLTLPAMSNSLGYDLVAENVVLRGKLQSRNRECGDLDGNVPLIGLSLEGDGDACMFIRTPEGGAAPTIDMGDYVCDPSMLPPHP